MQGNQRDADRQTAPPAGDLIDIPAAAEFLATSVRHVRELVYRRELPYFKVGPLVRFDRADLAAWLDGHRVEAADDRRVGAAPRPER